MERYCCNRRVVFVNTNVIHILRKPCDALLNCCHTKKLRYLILMDIYNYSDRMIKKGVVRFQDVLLLYV